MRRPYLKTAQVLLLTVSLFATSLAQTPAPKKRKKLKDFGSSLKRLQWDPQKNAAMELPATDEVANSEADVVRINTSLVSSDLLVLDAKGNPVSGLTAADFVIRENGASQTVGHFSNGDNVNVPRTIVLIIDYNCTQALYLKDSIKGAKLLVDKLGPKDLMAIVTDDVEMIQDFTSDKGKLKHKLTELYDRTRQDPVFWGRPGQARFGLNKQYSALMATLKEAFTVEDIRPIIIFQTGGVEAYVLRDPVVKLTIPEGLPTELLGMAETNRDFIRQALRENPVPFSLDDVYRTVQKSRVTIYTVSPGPQYMGLNPDVQMAKIVEQKRESLQNLRFISPPQAAHVRDIFLNRVQLRFEIDEAAKIQSALSQVAPLTGGWTAFLEKPEQANEIYSRIFTDINQRYIVGYYPTNKTHDGKRRKIDFEVKGHPEYQIMGRRAYFAPGP